MEMGDAFHAYIIDWRLPDMNGIEVTRQIRSLGDDTPIIILLLTTGQILKWKPGQAGVDCILLQAHVYVRYQRDSDGCNRPEAG